MKNVLVLNDVTNELCEIISYHKGNRVILKSLKTGLTESIDLDACIKSDKLIAPTSKEIENEIKKKYKQN